MVDSKQTSSKKVDENLDFLGDSKFFTNTLDRSARQALNKDIKRQVGHDPHLVDNKHFRVHSIEEVTAGLFNNALLKKIDVVDGSGDYRIPLMVKLLDPQCGKIWEKIKQKYSEKSTLPKEDAYRRVLDEEIIELWYNSVTEEASLEEFHMNFWHDAEVKAPLFLARKQRWLKTTKNRYKDLPKEKPLEVLISKFIPGVAIDKHFLFINEQLEKAHESDPVDHLDLDSISGDLETLKDKKDKLIKIILKSHSDFLIRTNYLLKADTQWKEEMTKFKHYSNVDNDRRMSRHVRSYYLWSAIMNGGLSIKEVTKNKVPKEFIENCEKYELERRDLFSSIIGILSDDKPSEKVYAQNDEFPHNQLLDASYDGQLWAYILDPDKAGITFREHALAKMLANNIIKLSAEEILGYAESIVEIDKESVRRIKDENRLPNLEEYYPHLDSFVINYNEQRIVLAMIYEGINLLGTNADHGIVPYAKERFAEMLRTGAGMSGDKYLFPEKQFQNRPVSTGDYNPRVANEFTFSQLHDFYKYALGASWCSNNLRSRLENQYKFLEKLKLAKKK